MKTKPTVSKPHVRREYNLCDKRQRSDHDLTEYERGILYGARQALGWVLRDNCAAPSKCISPSKP